MRAWMGMVVVAGMSWGCATVRVAQRDGCWVRQTETFPKTVREEVGPCARAEPKWSNDRVARLVQECMAEADYRWQTQAVAAWTRNQPLPLQQSEQTVMESCMGHAATAVMTENEALKRRVSELSSERDTLQSVVQQDREHLRSTGDRMTDALGEAAKKPAPAAIATANSSGTATTQSEQNAEPGHPSSTSITLPTTVTAPAPVIIREPPAPPPAPKRSPPTSCGPHAKPRSKSGGASAVQCVPAAPNL